MKIIVKNHTEDSEFQRLTFIINSELNKQGVERNQNKLDELLVELQNYCLINNLGIKVNYDDKDDGLTVTEEDIF